MYLINSQSMNTIWSYYYNCIFNNNIEHNQLNVLDKPIFKINDFIVYLSYLKSSKELAVHHIIDIVDGDGYLIKNKYRLDDFIINFSQQNDYMELEAAIETYPELFLSIKKINGPDDDLSIIIENYKMIKNGQAINDKGIK